MLTLITEVFPPECLICLAWLQKKTQSRLIHSWPSRLRKFKRLQLLCFLVLCQVALEQLCSKWSSTGVQNRNFISHHKAISHHESRIGTSFPITRQCSQDVWMIYNRLVLNKYLINNFKLELEILQDFFPIGALGSRSCCFEQGGGRPDGVMSSKARFTEWEQSDSTKLPKNQGTWEGGLPLVFLSVGVFMNLLAGCFHLINPPCTCHPIRFFVTGERVEGSFQGGVKSFQGWFPFRVGPFSQLAFQLSFIRTLSQEAWVGGMGGSVG